MGDGREGKRELGKESERERERKRERKKRQRGEVSNIHEVGGRKCGWKLDGNNRL